MDKQKLLNTYVNNVSMDEAVDYIESLLKKQSKSYTVAVNADVIMKIERDQLLKKITDEADLTIVDGQPLVWISRWQKRPVKQRISGSDLVPALCEMAAERGYSIFIIGGKDGVAKKAKRNLERMYKGIKIVGTYSPPLGFEFDDAELDNIIRIINSAYPDLLIACFGCPKQEKWIYQNYEKYNATVSVCAGATVDFLAGDIKRAPRWMSDNGLEWFYRFVQEPKRLFKRYFIDDVKIFGLMFKYSKRTKR